MGSTTDNWQNIAKKKQQEIKAAIPPKWIIPDEKLPSESQADVSDFLSQSGFFTNREIEIVLTNALKTLSYLSNGSWKSEDVTLAYCKAAAAAHQLVRPLFNTQINS
jgi:amidase